MRAIAAGTAGPTVLNPVRPRRCDSEGGQTQPRVVEIEGDALRLGTEAPIRSAGKVVMSYLEWQRAGNE